MRQVPFLNLWNTCGQLLSPHLSWFAWSNLFMSLPLPPLPLDSNLLKWLYTLLSLYFRHPSKAGVCGWQGSVGISDLIQCTKLNCWIMNGWMKTINTWFRKSPHCAQSTALHWTDPQSTLLTDFDVFENGEGRFLVSERVLFAQYVLALNPKTVIAPEVSKPELQPPSF